MNAADITGLQTIVLAVDGSEDSWAAVDVLRTLSLSQDASIHALSVLLPREASVKSWALMAVLERTRERLSGLGVSVTTQLLAGYPADELMGYCEGHRPDLIVLGAKGLRATIGILLGGVAQQIVEYACCPVLVVRAPYSGLKRVLLVVDGSLSSGVAVDYISQKPFPRTAELQVLHVLPPMDIVDVIGRMQWAGPLAPPPGVLDKSEEAAMQVAREEERGGKALLESTAEKLISYGLQPGTELRRGDAATEIIDYIRRNGIDLVIAGSRGLSQVQSWLLGSVSRKLVHYAGCSVLIVKQPEEG